MKGAAVPDYFDEMLARIRDIRASGRRMYLRVKEIFAMRGDYDPSDSETTKFSPSSRTSSISPPPA